MKMNEWQECGRGIRRVEVGCKAEETGRLAEETGRS